MRDEESRRVWSVREVTAALARRLSGLPSIWMEAEYHSGRRGGGQVYFTLVDGHQVSASMPEAVFDALEGRPHEGARVVVRGRVEFWPGKARLAFRADAMELSGEGALLARIARIRERLEKEGLFAQARKRTIPLLPRRVGLVTSARGAALDDFMATLSARCPGVGVVVVDVPVQGSEAAQAVARAVAALDGAPGVDVIVVTRGGGALEDLMPFNTELVCRAVAGSGVPVVSAVGHERDVTLCDLASDARAATPTAAATLVVPDGRALRQALDSRAERLAQGLRRESDEADSACQAGMTRLVQSLARRQREAELGLVAREHRARALVRQELVRAQENLHHRAGAGERMVRAAWARQSAAAEARQAVLTALSPYAVVRRGYAIVERADGRTVERASGLAPGDDVMIRMADGQVVATVREVQA